MRILAMGAHPDDIEYGCGGTLLRAVDHQHDVFVCVLTDGGINPEIDRRAEQEAAVRLLGAKELFWGGFPDTGLSAGRELIVAIEKVLAMTKPDMVLVNDAEDAHQDHRALALCATTACRYVKSVLFYHDYTSLHFAPDTFVDIEPYLEKKRRLLACHQSQVGKEYPTGLDLLESVTALASYYGFLGKTKYAEGFRPLRNLLVL